MKKSSRQRAAALVPFLAIALGSTFNFGTAQLSKREQDSVSAVVPSVRKQISPAMDKHISAELEKTRAELRRGSQMPGVAKTSLVTKGLTEPWKGMELAEKHGLDLAKTAGAKSIPLAAILDHMGRMLDKPPGDHVAKLKMKLKTLADHAKFMMAVLDKTKEAQDKALEKLSKKQRRFMFTWAPKIMANFFAQAVLNKDTKPRLHNDRAFVVLVDRYYVWPQFVGAARRLTYFADREYQESLRKALSAAKPIQEKIPGVTGPILFAKKTPHGLILFGGKGKNTYDLKVAAAVLVDLDGDDGYRGTIAASFDDKRRNGIVIDLGGNDIYEGKEFGLATGSGGGIGMLVDVAGNDTYKLQMGSGGVGIGGIGMLVDLSGDDVYTGSKYTQGVGLAGLGLLFDRKGKDRYTSFGFALGFGGPGGTGLVLDADGDDYYQCGKKYPSGYNQSDAKGAKPNDPRFQYDSFGMAMGLGRRILSRQREDHVYALAGGVGMIVDLKGDDRADSSNFSQACGYYFGIGLKLDLAGDDRHAAARYGHASGAHYGMGLFIDYSGKDQYTSTGPTYNGGCAWDHSAFLCIDAGTEDDVYNLKRSAGLGRADIGSWGAFADLGGNDNYTARGGLGSVSAKSVAVFFDAAGNDDYSGLAKSKKRNYLNKTTQKIEGGGLFVDR